MKSMRMINLVVAILLVVGLLPMATPAQAASASEWNRNDPYVPGEVVVSFAEGLSAKAYSAQASALAGSVGAMVSQQAGNLAVLQFDEGADVAALVEMVNASGMAAQAQPNYIYAMPETAGTMMGNVRIQTEYHVGSRPNSPVLSMSEVGKLNHLVKGKATPLFPNELSTGGSWGWDYAQVDLVWPTATSTSYKVCVVDTGIDGKHVDLSGKVTNLYDYVNDDTLPNDDNGHGTAVAGVISAKTNNGATTAMGASTAALYAVKSLNYEGVGTTYTVTAGIYKCANTSGIKILNLSWSMPDEDEMLYRAIYYAIVTKGQLVVAAAGNSSSSTPEYPAGWANTDYNGMTIASNMFYDPTAKVAPKQKADDQHKAHVAAGIISVAAGRPVGDYDVWVDLNQNTLATVDELFDSQQCATDFSNYGAWVSMAAPGESIFTTTPTSYPFYLNYEGQASIGYDTFSGTSFAAPFVTAAAARYWTSVTTTRTRDQVKTWLTTEDNGETLDLAVDALTDDASMGYDSTPSGNGIPYSDVDPYDINGTPDIANDDVYHAPFCWPTTGGSFGTDQNMTGKPYLNIAKALGRGGLWAAARFAADGSPAVGAVISAYDITSSTAGTLRDSSKLVNLTSPWVMLINLPVVTVPKVTIPETAIKPIQYKLGVSLSGYTTGIQYFNGVTAGTTQQLLYVAPGDFGSVEWNHVSYMKADYDPSDNSPTNQDDYNTVSLAPATHFRALLDWKDVDRKGNPFEAGLGTYPDMDLYTWLPINTPPHNPLIIDHDEGFVGTDHFDLPNYNGYNTTAPDLDLLDLGVGSLLDPLVLDPSGLFILFSPYAQYLFDGGYTPDVGGTPTSTVDYLAIKSSATLSVTPFLKPKYTGDMYTFMISDHNKAPEFASAVIFINNQAPSTYDQYGVPTNGSDYFVAPAFRLWSKGVLVADVRLEDAGATCSGTPDYDWWKPLTLSGTAPYITIINTCNTGSGTLNHFPYNEPQ